ncbi:cytochrome C551 [Alteribacter lacisalsi]|jgi:mono/diheme cytochrome c family protein|uniref:Cytochrome C551 n=1 Tax=Alteribacter lacisalsi TaxID=2045244 RepID=A0A2W0H6U8_9BACI|nr:cytochrome c [Alteribacter lacisalsi]PYZ95830.1 cytochrome C551 [Alteribacter lacisalsi]
MKKILIAMFGAALIAGACGGADDGDDDTTPVDDGDDTEETEDDEMDEDAADDGEYDLAQGEEIYEANCLSCHGGDGEGASAPAIQGLDMDAVRAAIEEGPGSMPADLVEDDDEIDNVAAYVADLE